jgi:hypothetical protein
METGTEQYASSVVTLMFMAPEYPFPPNTNTPYSIRLPPLKTIVPELDDIVVLKNLNTKSFRS